MTRITAHLLVLTACVAGQAIIVAAPSTVSQKGRRFSIATLTLSPGDRLVFKNDDEVVHNVYSGSPGLTFNLGAQQPGASSEHTFTAEGVAEVRCAMHPGMKMTVVVKK